MVRPIELQDLFAKTQAAERVTELQKAQLENQQRQAAAETAQRANDKRHKPVATTKSDEVILHRDRDEKDKNDKKKSDDETEDAQAQTEAEPDDGNKSHDDGTPDDREPPPSLDLTA
jgi:type II secretory pathway pseudopilin PulG